MFQPFEHFPRDGRRMPRDGARGRPSERSERGGRAPAGGIRLRIAELDGQKIRGAWLVAPMMLLALASALRFAARGQDSSFATCFAMLLGLGVAWVGIRLCLPPPAPPHCPHCRRRALVRLHPEHSQGARCLHCGWRDDDADARLLGAPIAAQLHRRGTVHVARPALAPHRGITDPRPGGRSDGRPPRGPSGRRRRLR